MGALPSTVPVLALMAWVALASLLGGALAGLDKRRARAGGRRIPERLLLAVALLGGWPGELLAFLALRHKTRKPRFLLPFVACAAGNAAALGWLLGARG